MLERIPWRRQVTCPSPESLVPHALGGGDSTVARHLEGCSACQAELARLQEAAGLLRARTVFESRAPSAGCLDEAAVADFVEGRLSPEARAPLVSHLLTCAHCRSVVQATGQLLANDVVTRELPRGAGRPWRRWSLPLGIAAAAAVLLLVWPRGAQHTDPIPDLRERPQTTATTPVPITPRSTVSQVDRLVWSSMSGVDRYRLRLYDGEGAVLWSTETADTIATLPDSVVPTAPGTYFWKVEAQTELGRWAGSELTEFRLLRSPP
jgi:putative zinc finger protein